MVPGVVGQHLGPVRPYLVDLRGELHEIARHFETGQQRIADVGEQAVQRVPELVEQRGDFTPGHEHRLALRGLGDVQVVDHHGPLAQQMRLDHQRVHPGTAPLGLACVEVPDVQPERTAVGVVHLEDPGVRVVRHQVGALGQGDAVDQPGGVEDPVAQYGLQLQVGRSAAASRSNRSLRTRSA